MEIFANHAHAFPDDIRPEGSIESLLRLLDECGIARAVCFAPHRSTVGSRGYPEPNEWLAEAIADQPRLVGFGCIRPVDEDAVARLEAMVQMGMRGCKIHPASDKFDILDDRAMEFYAAAEELDVVLDFHTGPHWYRIKHYHPLGFDEICWKHKQLKMVFEHIGGYPFYHDMLAVLGNNLPFNRPGHLFGGISSILNRELQRLWYIGIEAVGDAIFRLGEGMPIYGLDFPYNSVELVQDEIRQLKTLDISAEGMAKLFGGNLERAIESRKDSAGTETPGH